MRSLHVRALGLRGQVGQLSRDAFADLVAVPFKGRTRRVFDAVLHDAGLLADRRYTAHFSVASELTTILADQRVVADDRILTSRGAGTALDFGLLLVEKLFSAEKSREIGQSVCA